MMRARKSENGAVLVVVLWVVAFLFAILAGVSASIMANASVSRALGRSIQFDAARLAGIETAAAGLLADDPDRRWMTDGRPYSVLAGNSQILVRVWDISALVDVNRADPALLRNLFVALAGPAAAASAARIVEYRGSLTVAGRDPGAAVGLGSSTAPMLTPARRISRDSDLRKLLAGEPAVVARLLPFLTVYGRTGRVNPQFAPREVLNAVPDISPSEVAALLNRNGDGIARDAQAIVAKYAAFFDKGEGTLFRVAVEVQGTTRISTLYVRRGLPSPYYIVEQNAP